MTNLVESVAAWALLLIKNFGYLGIFLTMAMESAAIPIPSEVVLPFAGFLAASGVMNLWLVVLVATLANLTGSIATYGLGFWGGRPFLEKYGRYFLISRGEIEKMHDWLSRRGALVAFFSRLLPGVRTFSSLVIGSGRPGFIIFAVYTFLGSFFWNLALAYIGFVGGDNRDLLITYFRKFDILIIILLVLAVAYYIFHKINNFRK